jgi:hypothetical protein
MGIQGGYAPEERIIPVNMGEENLDASWVESGSDVKQSHEPRSLRPMSFVLCR